MKLPFIAILCVVTLAACGGEASDTATGRAVISNGVTSCDLRQVVGTCLEYRLDELDEWYQAYVERSCPEHRRGELAGIYRSGLACPSAGRVARCSDIVEAPGEMYEYDKHYYSGTAPDYPWRPDDIRISCENVSGRFLVD